MRHKSEWTELRNALNLSQPELASFLGISRSAMAMIETGERQLEDSPELNFLRNFVARIKNDVPGLMPYGFTEHERQDIIKRRIITEAKLNTTRKKYEASLAQSTHTALMMQHITSMDFSSLNTVSKRLQLWQTTQLADKDIILYRNRKSKLLSLEIKMKTLEAELACLERALADE